MKKLAAIIAMLAGASALFAQSIFVVDFAQVHQNYYKTKAVVEQLQSAAASANAELKAMQEKLVAMNEELKALDEKFKNPALADAAKEEIKKEAPGGGKARQPAARSFRRAQQRNLEDCRKNRGRQEGGLHL